MTLSSFFPSFEGLLAAAILGAIGYVYFGYPFLLRVLSRRPAGAPLSPSVPAPTVSLIIAAHDEEGVIERKIANTLALEYPADRLEIVVASDGSEDATDAIVARYAGRGVRLHRLPERRGKLPAISSAAAATDGEILVFSDAHAMYAPDALARLVEPFRDARTGCVCGELLYENPEGTAISDGETLYWRYENRLKEWESRFNSLIGATGAIYAVRRAAYVPIDLDISDDYGIPLAVYAHGYRVVYQASALAREAAPDTMRSEFQKKVRWVAQQLTTLSRLWPMLRPFHDPKLLFQLVSHKLLRSLVPFLLLSLVPVSLAMEAPAGGILLGAQGLFYGLALCGALFYRRGLNMRLCTVPMYFCVVNAAAALGVFYFLRRMNYTAWDEKTL